MTNIPNAAARQIYNLMLQGTSPTTPVESSPADSEEAQPVTAPGGGNLSSHDPIVSALAGVAGSVAQGAQDQPVPRTEEQLPIFPIRNISRRVHAQVMSGLTELASTNPDLARSLVRVIADPFRSNFLVSGLFSDPLLSRIQTAHPQLFNALSSLDNINLPHDSPDRITFGNLNDRIRSGNPQLYATLTASSIDGSVSEPAQSGPSQDQFMQTGQSTQSTRTSQSTRVDVQSIPENVWLQQWSYQPATSQRTRRPGGQTPSTNALQTGPTQQNSNQQGGPSPVNPPINPTQNIPNQIAGNVDALVAINPGLAHRLAVNMVRWPDHTLGQLLSQSPQSPSPYRDLTGQLAREAPGLYAQLQALNPNLTFGELTNPGSPLREPLMQALNSTPTQQSQTSGAQQGGAQQPVFQQAPSREMPRRPNPEQYWVHRITLALAASFVQSDGGDRLSQDVLQRFVQITNNNSGVSLGELITGDPNSQYAHLWNDLRQPSSIDTVLIARLRYLRNVSPGLTLGRLRSLIRTQNPSVADRLDALTTQGATFQIDD